MCVFAHFATVFDLSVIYSENFQARDAISTTKKATRGQVFSNYFLENDYVEMDREEAEEKCLVQQQIIMDQMKQLKKVDLKVLQNFFKKNYKIF